MAEDAAQVDLPDTRAGRQLRWYLERIASGGAGASEADRARFSPAMPSRRWALPADEAVQEAWRRLASQLGGFDLASFDARSDLAMRAVVEGTNGKRWRISCQVEESEPHRIAAVEWQREFDFEVTVREATAADAAALAEIERRCPIVLGGTSVAFDRGDDYFAFARLMEDVTVGLGLVDGVPAAINCGAVHKMRVGGIERRLMTAIHTRVLPEHQGKGLWGAVSRILSEKYPPGEVDGSHGFVSVDNAAMQKGFANTPHKWDTQAVRGLLDCASLAGPRAGRPATPADAPRIAEMLNACHEGEEMYQPYSVESLTARLDRAPRQYSWERVWVSEGAVVGVWPAGESVRLVIESDGKRTESLRGLVLDYGFLPGAEDELEAPRLRGWCGRLAAQGFDTLSIFTSLRSAGFERLRSLARDVEAFDMWTPGLPPPAAHGERGLYVDQVYF